MTPSGKPAIKCTNEECLLADLCLRFTMEPRPRQPYTRFAPSTSGCLDYWENDKGRMYSALSGNDYTIPF